VVLRRSKLLLAITPIARRIASGSLLLHEAKPDILREGERNQLPLFCKREQESYKNSFIITENIQHFPRIGMLDIE